MTSYIFNRNLYKKENNYIYIYIYLFIYIYNVKIILASLHKKKNNIYKVCNTCQFDHDAG